MDKDSFAYIIVFLIVFAACLLFGAWLCNWLFGGSKSTINELKEKV